MMFPFPSAQFLKQDCQERQMSSQEKVKAEVLDEESAETSRNRTAAILATFFMGAPFGVRSLDGAPLSSLVPPPAHGDPGLTKLLALFAARELRRERSRAR
jgi:hypothetical protein